METLKLSARVFEHGVVGLLSRLLEGRGFFLASVPKRKVRAVVPGKPSDEKDAEIAMRAKDGQSFVGLIVQKRRITRRIDDMNIFS
jgi:hypothetical protein